MLHYGNTSGSFLALQGLVSLLFPPLPPFRPAFHFHSAHSLLFFSLYLTRSVSHSEEIRNADGSLVVTATFLSDLCPSPALHPFSPPPPLSSALPHSPPASLPFCLLIITSIL